MKKNLLTACAFLLAVTALTGYGVAQLLVSKELSGTVKIRIEGDLGLYDVNGTAVSALDFGEVARGVWVNRTVFVRNTGNVFLNLTCARTDSNNPPISTNFANLDGSWFAPSQPKPMQPSDEIALVIELRANDAAAGVYDLAFVFRGEG